MRDVQGLARLSMDEVPKVGKPVSTDCLFAYKAAEALRVSKVKLGPVKNPPLPDWVETGVTGSSQYRKKPPRWWLSSGLQNDDD